MLGHKIRRISCFDNCSLLNTKFSTTTITYGIKRPGEHKMLTFKTVLYKQITVGIHVK